MILKKLFENTDQISIDEELNKLKEIDYELWTKYLSMYSYFFPQLHQYKEK